MIAEGVSNRFVPKQVGQFATRYTGLGSVAVAQVETPGLEITRAGRRFHGIFSTTGQAPVQAIPTTTATWVLYNADPNRSYVVDDVSAFFLSGTAGIGAQFLGGVFPILAAITAGATGAAVGSRSAGGLISKGILTTAYTLTAPTAQYQWGFLPMAAQLSVAPAAAGTGVGTAVLAGQMIIPPGKLGAFALLAPTGTTPLYVAGCSWHELELDDE